MDLVSKRKVEGLKSMFKKGSFMDSVCEFFRVIWKNKMARIGLIIITFFISLAVFGPMFENSLNTSFNFARRLQAPSSEHWLGTDYAGRDILSMFILGSRTVLLVATYAGIFTVLFACAVGITAGLMGGKVDTFLSFLIDVVLTIPGFPVLMVLAMIFDISNDLFFGLVLSLWSWPWLAKSIRVQVVVLRNKEFIEASVLMGISTLKIIINDIIPNIISFIAINFIIIMKSSIVASIGLMILGVVPFNGQHWGMMMQMALSQTSVLFGGFQALVNFLTPVMGIFLFQLGCYLFAMGLDEAMNPRLR